MSERKNIQELLNEGFYQNDDSIRNVPVSIGGSPISLKLSVKEDIDLGLNPNIFLNNYLYKKQIQLHLLYS